MNFARVARLLGAFSLFFTGVTLVPLVVAWFEPSTPYDTRTGFGLAAIVGGLVSAALYVGSRRAPAEFYRREGLTVVGLAWVIAGLLGALPLLASGALTRFSDAVFESVSGLSTTGATVFGGAAGNPAIEALPKSLLLWRSMLQWVGGTGVILLFTVLLPTMGLTAKNLLDSEQVGVTRADQKPRMREQARLLLRLYVVLTALAFAGYLLTGMGAFDAVCHAMTTVATGGFSTRNASLGAYQSLGTELVAVVFMFLAGTNFVLLLSTVRHGFVPRRLWESPEFRAYAKIVLGAVSIVTVVLWTSGLRLEDELLDVRYDYSDPLLCLRHALFQVVSIVSSTGYSTANFQNWPNAAWYLLVVGMLIGGSTGSTAGGFKVFRVLVCAKLVDYSTRVFVRPRAVQRLRLGDDVLPNSLISAVLTLLILWICVIGVGTLVLDLDARLDPVAAFTASVSMVGCTGPAITQVIPVGDVFQVVNPGGIDVGPYGSYALLHGYAKLFMALQMILGRLEILAPLVLLFPRFWRRS